MLVYFVLAAAGLTQILVYSTLFEPIRPSRHFFRCPMCVGFWSGILMLLLNPYTELFTFEVNVANALILGSLASGTSYALCNLFSDGGLRIEYTNTGNLDTEVDATTSSSLLQG